MTAPVAFYNKLAVPAKPEHLPDFLTREHGKIEQALRGPSLLAMTVINVDDLGADPTGARDSVPAFTRALRIAERSGWNAVLTGRGPLYKFVETVTATVPVPINGPNYTTLPETLRAHFYVLEPDRLTFNFPDSTFWSEQSGHEMFLLNGPRDVTFNVGRWLGAAEGTVGSSSLTVQGLNMIAVTTTTRDGWNLQIPQMWTDHSNVSLYVFGDAASAYRMRGITVGNLYHEWGTYGIALHNNGDDVVVGNCVTYAVGRPGFLYGVSNVRGRWHSLQRLGGLAFLVKAYDRDTTDLDLTYRVVQENTSVEAIGFASEHNVAAQPTPAALRNIVLNYDDTDSGASMVGIRGQYLVDGVSTPTVGTTIFDNLTIRGTMDGSDGIDWQVTQTPAGLLNIDSLLKDGARLSNAVFAAGGFYGIIGGCIVQPVVSTGLALSAATTTDTTQYGMTLDHRGSSAATSLIVGSYLKTGTVAASYTAALVHTLRLANPEEGAGSTITKAVGLFIEDMTTGATNLAIEAVDPISVGGAALTAAATTQAAGVVALGNATQSTVGAAGGASALPATPSGYLRFFLGGTEYVIPYYAQA